VLVTIRLQLGAGKARAQQPAATEIQGTDQSQTATQISAPAPQASAPQTTHRFWDRPMTCGLRE